MDPSPSQPRLVLYDFPTSPFCAKVRAALMHQRVVFDTVDATAPRHWWRLRRQGTGKVPALAIDGRLVDDSTDICLELHRLFPGRPLLPPEPEAAARCHLIEDWCDESLYFVALHRVWMPESNHAMVRRRFMRGPFGALAFRAYRQLIAGQLRGQGTGRKTEARIEADLLRHLDHLQALLGDKPFLLGERPWLCDFALFGQLRFLGFDPHAAALLQQRPALLAYRDRVKDAARA